MEIKPEIDEKNIDFLVTKSRYLLAEQFKTYEGSIFKSGLLISLLAIIFPISMFLFSKEMNCIIKAFGIIPIVILIIALCFLLIVLLPKALNTGFNFEQFDEKINYEYINLLLYEIGANKSAFKGNKDIVDRQTLFFKLGIIFVAIALIFLMILIFISTIV